MKSHILLLAAAIFAGPAFAQDAPKGDAAKGEKLFMADGCWQCHGVGGNGAALIAANHLVALMGQVERVAASAGLPLDAFAGLMRAASEDALALGPGAALTGPKLSQTALPFEAFLHQLRRPAAEMAPYEAAIVPDSAAADIYAFLKSRPASPDLKDLPLLQGMGVK